MTKYLLILLFIFLFSLPLFAQEVDTAWVRRYNGPVDWAEDVALAIAVDNSGNVYVTGYSSQNNTVPFNYDYTTIKYLPNGDTGWVRRYTGPVDSSDAARSIALDGSGNIYVTGFSWGSGTFADYTTIKYYPHGDTAWVRRYDGPGNGSDEALALVTDGAGNIYVTGTSFDSATSNDYATIKYYPNGDTAWVRRYNGPTDSVDVAVAIAIDGSGNVYVTGDSRISSADRDYATIKYASSGNELWVRRYNGPGNSIDWGNDLAIDSSGNVYVTGLSIGSGSSFDYATIKYYPNGDAAWIRRYTGPGNQIDRANALSLDGSGNICVTGYSYDSSTSRDYTTIKYYPNGDTAWMRKYDGQDIYSPLDEANAIAVDGSDNIYVTGFITVSGAYPPDRSYATVKYSPNGNELWVARYDGPGFYEDRARALAVDGSGNVYVTGSSPGVATGNDYATIKYFQFLRGDANSDQLLNVTDVIYLINYLFKSGPAPDPLKKANANCDGQVNVTDVIYLVNYLFKGGPKPAC